MYMQIIHAITAVKPITDYGQIENLEWQCKHGTWEHLILLQAWTLKPTGRPLINVLIGKKIEYMCLYHFVIYHLVSYTCSCQSIYVVLYRYWELFNCHLIPEMSEVPSDTIKVGLWHDVWWWNALHRFVPSLTAFVGCIWCSISLGFYIFAFEGNKGKWMDVWWQWRRSAWSYIIITM